MESRSDSVASNWRGDLIPAEEQAGHPHRVDIALRRGEAGLSGFVTSRIANARGVFALPSYVRLQKQK